MENDTLRRVRESLIRTVPWDDLRAAVERVLDKPAPPTPEARRLAIDDLDLYLSEMRRRVRDESAWGGPTGAATAARAMFGAARAAAREAVKSATFAERYGGALSPDQARAMFGFPTASEPGERRSSVAAGAWEDPPNPGETFAQYWDRTRGAECGTWAEVHAGAGLPPEVAPVVCSTCGHSWHGCTPGDCRCGRVARERAESVPPARSEAEAFALKRSGYRRVRSGGRVIGWGVPGNETHAEFVARVKREVGDEAAATPPDALACGAVTYALTRGAVADAIASGSTIYEAVDIGARAFAAASAAEADELPAGARALAADFEAVERDARPAPPAPGWADPAPGPGVGWADPAPAEPWPIDPAAGTTRPRTADDGPFDVSCDECKAPARSPCVFIIGGTQNFYSWHTSRARRVSAYAADEGPEPTPGELRARARRVPIEWLKPIFFDAPIAADVAELFAIAHDRSPWPLPACSTCKQPAGAGPRNRLVVPKLGFARFPIFLVPCPACIPGAADDRRRRALALACAQEVRRLKLEVLTRDEHPGASPWERGERW